MTTDDAKFITDGNEDAARFLLVFVRYCHLLDDIADRDQEVSNERLVYESLLLVEELLLNPFVRTYGSVLWPLIVSGANSWLDATEWEKSRSKTLQRDADVLKGFYHEVCWMTARLCGGWDHMRKVTRKLREYDHNRERD